ncbi:MAG: acylphosphatase [Thermovirgaceae bacterium]
MSEKEAYVRISGIVQGVGFRWRALQKAEELDLKGWIRNRPDGDVDAVLQGNIEKIKTMIGWMERGPSNALVRNIEVEWKKGEKLYEDFIIHRS